MESLARLYQNQPGAKLLKNGKLFYIPRELQQNQAAMAGLDWKP